MGKKFKKAPKDKNAPKKPLTPFFLFSQEKREEVSKANPEMKLAQIGKKMGELWRGLSDEEKAPYKERTQKAMEAYKAVRAEYEQSENYREYKQQLADWREDKKRAEKKRAKSLQILLSNKQHALPKSFL